MADNASQDGDGTELPSLDEFSERLERLRGETVEPAAPKQPVAGRALGRAMRISTEMVVGLLVGTLLGVMLDRWLGTAPLFLLVGIGIGFAAGLRNMSRLLKEEQTEETAPDADGKNENG